MAIFNSYVSLPEGNHDSSEVLTHPQIYLWKIAEPCRASQSQQSSIRRPTKRADPCFPETMGFSPWKSHGKSMGNRWQQWNESSLVIHWWNWTPGKWSLIHGGSALLDRERERESHQRLHRLMGIYEALFISSSGSRLYSFIDIRGCQHDKGC